MARSGEPAAHQRRRSENLCERDWNTEDLFPRISDAPSGKSHPFKSAPKKNLVRFSKVRRIKSYLKKNVKLKEKKMDGMICIIAFVTHEAHGVTNL
jgi:hypothetical protein